MNTKILFTLALGALLGASPQDDAKKDQAKLQGKWIMTAGVVDGNELPADQVKSELVFKDDKYTFTESGGEGGSGTYKVDPTKKPKTMDAVPADGPVKGQTVEEIYEIDGDNLKICLALPGTKRATEFKAPAGSGLMLFTYKRAK